MNWFTRSIVAHYPHEIKKKEVQRWGGCEHVIADASLLYAINYENDSFGRDGYCVCEDCYKAAETARDEEFLVCDDCCRSFSRKNLLAWMAYDHNPREGDQVLYVCAGCQTKDTHLKRVRRDQEARYQEFGDDY